VETRSFIVQSGFKPVMSGDTPSVMHSSLHIWAIWLERLLEGLELRLGRHAVQNGQVERGDSEEMACGGGGEAG